MPNYCIRLSIKQSEADKQFTHFAINLLPDITIENKNILLGLVGPRLTILVHLFNPHPQ